MSAASMVETIDALITDLLADFKNITSYKISTKSVEKHQALRELRKLRAQYLAESQDEPYEDIRHVAFDISDFGEDESEYIGDE
jgi:tRNA uridine 5-carbamoylmethylation protein Kti12